MLTYTHQPTAKNTSRTDREISYHERQRVIRAHVYTTPKVWCRATGASPLYPQNLKAQNRRKYSAKMELIATAIFHCEFKIIGRTSGRSSVGAAAYRAGENLKNERDGITHDFTNKRGIVYTEIMLPNHAPEAYKDRETLWNAVEKIEKAKDAQTAREVEIGLPTEFTRQEQIRLTREYIKANFVDRGMCADIAIHDKRDGNPHAHVMLTMRSIDEGGNWLPKSKKIYDLDANGNRQYDPMKRQYKCHKETVNDWDKKENIERWREQWAATCNREFEKKNYPITLDHRSYERQGKEKIATIHLGPIVHQLNKRGIKTERAEYNNEVRQINQVYENTKIHAEKELWELKKDFDEYEKEKAAATKKKPTAEEITNAINGLKFKYINLEYEKIVQEEARSKRQREIQTVKWKIDDLQRRQKTITRHDTDIDRLQAERERLGIFHGKAKRQIDEDVADLQASKKFEVSSLYGEYQIKPGQIDSYLKKLNDQLNELLPKPTNWAEYEKARDSRPPSIEEQQTAIKNRYDQVMKSLERHPERDKIKSALERTNFETNSKDKALFQIAVHNTKAKFLTYTPPLQERHERTITRTRSYEMER